jgi:alkylation response protein AidB-like acyl-CoA dehydrogenase
MKELQDAVRALLSKRSDVRAAIDQPHGYDESLWQVLCEQIGVAALAIPEQYGGAGATLAETHVVMVELGRRLTPSPLLSSVLSSQLLLSLGDDDACTRLLPRIAGGAVAAFAEVGADGVANFVLDGDIAEILLVSDGTAVYEIDPPTTRRTHTPTMDATRRLASVTVTETGRRLGNADVVASVLDQAAVALTAEQVGAAERILELTVEYSKTRVQFGRPIGSFQALKHRMADLYVLAEAARSASFAAVAGSVAPSIAKAYCSEAFFTIAAECIQLHGGIAITWEHDAQLYFKRAHGSAQLFGPPDEHIRRLEAQLLSP